MTVRILVGDWLEQLRTLPDESAHMACTSPPYFGLRDYGVPGQVGLEATPEAFVAKLVEGFREVRRVLRKDGTLWLNLGASFSGSGKGPTGVTGLGDQATRQGFVGSRKKDAPSYGMTDIVPAGYPGDGWSSTSLCDGCRAVLSARNVRSETRRALESDAYAVVPNQDHTRSRSPENLPPLTQTERSNHATLDPLPSLARADEQRHASLESTPQQSAEQPPEDCRHCANCGACLSVLRSSARDAQACVRNSAVRPGSVGCTHGSASPCGGPGQCSRCTAGYCSPLSPYVQPHCTSPYKPKDMIPTPWLLALALQADGWYLRSDIIWSKPSPMPESVTDRPTRAHEYVFLLSKSRQYFFDANAVREGIGETGVIQRPDLDNERALLGKNGRLHVAPMERAGVAVFPAHFDGSDLAFGVRLASAILDRPAHQEQFGLTLFDTQVRQESPCNGSSPWTVSNPIVRRATAQAARFADGDISAKDFLREIDRLCVALPDGDDLKELWAKARRPAAPPVVAINSDSNGAVAVDHSSQVGQLQLIHNQSIPVEDTTSLAGRNIRSVWEIATSPFPSAHFATYPVALVEPCIKAGASEKGCCPVCGAPIVRVVEKAVHTNGAGRGHIAGDAAPWKDGWGGVPRGTLSVSTTGWRPSCAHPEASQPVPCTVLDPFGGAGTTALVADRLGRDCILIELSPTYAAMAQARLVGDSPMFTEVVA